MSNVETILEDDGPCFQRFGPVSYWHDETTGHGAHSVWTYTIDEAVPDNWVRWNLNFAQAGSYEEAARRLQVDRRTVKARIDLELLKRLRRRETPSELWTD